MLEVELIVNSFHLTGGSRRCLRLFQDYQTHCITSQDLTSAEGTVVNGIRRKT